MNNELVEYFVRRITSIFLYGAVIGIGIGAVALILWWYILPHLTLSWQ